MESVSIASSSFASFSEPSPSEEIQNYKDLSKVCSYHKRHASELHRNRKVWSGEGVIYKVVLAEGQPWHLSSLNNDPSLSKTSVADVFDNDGTGMNTGVHYSLKKKNRHLLPEKLEADLPEFENVKLPAPLKTVSMKRSPFYKSTGVFTPFLPLKGSQRAAKKLLVKTADGKVTVHEGAIPSDYQFLVSDEKQTPKLHLQYVVVEGDSDIHRMKSKCSCDSCRFPPAPIMPRNIDRLGKDIPRSGYLVEEEFDDDDYHLEEDVTVEQPEDCNQPQKVFNLTDIPLQKAKKRGKDKGPQDWIVV